MTTTQSPFIYTDVNLATIGRGDLASNGWTASLVTDRATNRILGIVMASPAHRRRNRQWFPCTITGADFIGPATNRTLGLTREACAFAMAEDLGLLAVAA